MKITLRFLLFTISFALVACGVTILNYKQTINRYEEYEKIEVLEDFLKWSKPEVEEVSNLLNYLTSNTDLKALQSVVGSEYVDERHVDKSIDMTAAPEILDIFILSKKISQNKINEIISTADSEELIKKILKNYNTDETINTIIDSPTLMQLPGILEVMLQNTEGNATLEKYVIESGDVALTKKIASSTVNKEIIDLIIGENINNSDVFNQILINKKINRDQCRQILENNINFFNSNRSALSLYTQNNICKNNFEICVTANNRTKCNAGLTFEYLTCWSGNINRATLQRGVGGGWLNEQTTSSKRFTSDCFAGFDNAVKFTHAHLLLDDAQYRVFIEPGRGYRSQYDNVKVVVNRK